MIYFLSICIHNSFIKLSILNKYKGPGGSMSYVAGLPNNSYKPITNTTWVRARLCKLQKGCTRLGTASDKVYQLLAHGRWFSPASSTTKTGRHDIAEILLKVSLSTKNQSINQTNLNNINLINYITHLYQVSYLKCNVTFLFMTYKSRDMSISIIV